MTSTVITAGQTSSGLTIPSGSTLTVKAGGIAVSTTVSGGAETVSSGGMVSSSTLVSGGFEFVSAGGSAVDTIISNGGFRDVFNGGTATGTTVASGGVERVYTGGTTTGTVVSSGGTQNIFGGTVISTTVDSGGVELLDSGIASGTIVSSGGGFALYSPGASAVSAQIYGDPVTVYSGATATGTVLFSGTQLTVKSGGVVSTTSVGSGSYEFDSGTAISTTVSAGGNEYVEKGGTATGTTVFGGQAIASGGSAAGTTVSSGGTLTVSSGGVATGAIVGGSGLALVISSGTASNTVLSGGGTLEVQSGGIVTGSVTFSGTGDILKIDGTGLPTDPSTLIGATISGFAGGDEIDLQNIGFSAAGHVSLIGGNELQITENGTTYDLQLDPSQSFAGDFFHLANDGGGHTLITENATPCYCRGTLIRTADGEVPVENLRIGHWVVTLGGESLPIKWIGRRSYRDWQAVGNDDVQPICFKAGSIADHVPARDLFVSPEHAMFVDGVLVPARHLVNGVSILKMEGMERIDYFHLEFDRHVVIFAEDAKAESFVDDDSRMLFHNADEYRRLYPNEPRRRVEFCAPRVEDGPALASLHQALAARAQHLRADSAAAPWGQRGKVEVATARLITGWAFSGADAGPVSLVVLVNGAVIGRLLADRYRPDLKAAGIGDGRHGFRFTLPKGLAADITHRIEVRREIDWSPLVGVPVILVTGRSTDFSGAIQYEW